MTLLYQLADSAFPSGGFAHSAGLEAAVQAGTVQGGEGLARFCEEALWQAGHGSLPLVTAAHRHPSELAALDLRCEAFLVNHVQRRASRTQGRAFLDTSARVFGGAITTLRLETRRLGLVLHHAPLFGAIVSTLGVPLHDAQHLHLWLGLRGAVSAGVRLGVVGTFEAQTIQSMVAPTVDRVLATCATREPSVLAQTSPLFELLSGTHDRLYSRLFQS